jgi:hypothetical protein
MNERELTSSDILSTHHTGAKYGLIEAMIFSTEPSSTVRYGPKSSVKVLLLDLSITLPEICEMASF